MSALSERIRALRRAGLTTEVISGMLGITAEQVVARDLDPSLANPAGAGGGAGLSLGVDQTFERMNGYVPFDLSGDAGWTEITDATRFACRSDGTIEFGPGLYAVTVQAASASTFAVSESVGDLYMNPGDLGGGNTGQVSPRENSGFTFSGGAIASWRAAWRMELLVEAVEGNENLLTVKWDTNSITPGTPTAHILLAAIAHTI